ncbi:MAG: dipeptide/oligopeptide/nickel ABC transporter ATP-binding protein [Myxococcota bacterium]
MNAWELVDVHKQYPVGGWTPWRPPWRPGRSHPALHGATLEVGAGERIGLIGESGSGKTTLVRCGLGLVRADGGTIRVLGTDTRGYRPRDWRALRREVQVLFQDPRSMLHPDLPIGVLLEESAALHRPELDPAVAAREALRSVELDHRADALPRELSGGERRRAGIARVSLARPRLLVADEPTSGLDAVLKPRMVELLVAAAGPGCAVVLVSHDLAAIEPVCHRIAVLHHGRVVETFGTDALRAGYRPIERPTADLLEAAGWPAAGGA